MIYKNKHNLPPEVYTALTADNYAHNFDPKFISATSLIKSPKERVLALRHHSDIETDVMENVWRVFGSACHHIFENQKTDNIKERRLSVEIDGMTLTGQSDLYLPKDKMIRDYKVTSVWHIVFGEKESFKDYTNQLNIYAYLHEVNDFEVNGLEVVAILRDFNKRESALKPELPQEPIISIPIALWSKDEQERYIKERIALHKQVLGLADDDIPVCSPAERWEKPGSWAIHKGNNIKAMKVCSNKADAELFMANYGKQYPLEKLRLEERLGKCGKCEGYCSAQRFCNFGKSLLAAEIK